MNSEEFRQSIIQIKIYNNWLYADFANHLSVFDEGELSEFKINTHDEFILKTDKGNILIKVCHNFKDNIQQIRIFKKHYIYKNLVVTYMLATALIVESTNKRSRIVYKNGVIHSITTTINYPEYKKSIDFYNGKKFSQKLKFEDSEILKSCYDMPNFVVFKDKILSISFFIKGKSIIFLDDEIDFLDDSFKKDPFRNKLSLESQSLLEILTI